MEGRQRAPSHQEVERPAQAVDEEEREQHDARDRGRIACAGELSQKERKRVAADPQRRQRDRRLHRSHDAERFSSGRHSDEKTGTCRQGGDGAAEREGQHPSCNQPRLRHSRGKHRRHEAAFFVAAGCAAG